MKTKNIYLNLFFTMFKIGLFTFGGGYAMISLIRSEFVEKRAWLTCDEFYNMVAIAESTPGPIAINCATFIGYKFGKVLGSAIATVAVCIPSFVIIYVISLFLNQFLENEWVSYAFKGIQVGVAYLILSAGLKMVRELDKNLPNILLLLGVITAMILFTLFSVNFSSIFYILIGAVVGLVIFAVQNFKVGKK